MSGRHKAAMKAVADTFTMATFLAGITVTTFFAILSLII